jgi:DNA-binding beta-propeller fold protein YncE
MHRLTGRVPAGTIGALFPFVVLLLFASSCAPSKAFIDQSASGQIIWPGPPDPPRIKFLWSISQISGSVEGRRGFLDFLAGGIQDDVTDPRTSNVLMRPFAVFADAREKLYIADPGAARVTVVDLKTSDVLNIQQAGKDDLVSPTGVAADGTGRIFIVDSVLAKVFVMDEKGALVSTFRGDFQRPTCIAIDQKTQTLYVSDTLEHAIFIYSPDGKRLGKIGSWGSGPGELNFPTHLFVDSNGLLYVTDAMNFRVQIFGPDGKVVGSVGTQGDSAATLDKIKGVAADREGHIYVVDSIQDTVKIFDRQGRLLLYFGEKGDRYGEFWLPSGIFIDSRDVIYVADTYNMRVQAFQYIGGTR